jgi:hypothetical protein
VRKEVGSCIEQPPVQLEDDLEGVRRSVQQHVESEGRGVGDPDATVFQSFDEPLTVLLTGLGVLVADRLR